MIACQEKVLTWIAVSFVDYYGFLAILFMIVNMTSDAPAVKTKRFRMALFLAFLFVPFMTVRNLYGNFMIKQDYFKKPAIARTVAQNQHSRSIDPDDGSIIVDNTN